MPPSSEGNPVSPISRLPIAHVFGEARFHADGDLLALTFAADGTLWSIEEQGQMRQWNPTTGRPLQEHFLSDLETLWVFSPQARLLAAASDDLSLWDVPTAKLRTTITQASWVTTVVFAPDCSVVATGHDDGKVRLWDIGCQKMVAELAAHEQPVSALAFSADGTRLASAAEDRLIHLWEVAGAKLQATLTGHTDRIPALAWHPQGKQIVSAGWDTTARVWETSKGEPVILLNSHADQVTDVLFSPDGKTLACVDSDNAIHLWHSANWQTQHILSQHDDEVRSITYSADGRMLASGGAERVIHVWDPQRGRLLSGSNSSSRHSISVAGNAQRSLLASNSGGTAFHVWDPATAKPIIDDDLNGMLATACCPRGHWLAAGGSDTRIRLWHAANGQPYMSLIGQRGPVAALTLSPTADLLASASASDGTVWLWNLTKGEPALLILEAADGCTVEALAFHPEGRYLACGGIDWMATGGTDGAICVWDVQQSAKIAIFEHGTTSMAYHPSGRWLAAASLDEVVLIWEVASQQLVAELGGHKEGVSCIAYSPDGRWLASGSDDRTLRMWDAESRQPLSVHQLETSIQSLAFSPDSRYLFTGNGNTTCYQLETARLLEE
jgi:WD40 repeat protein